MIIPKALESLEQRRAGIAGQIAELGDLRSGSVTSTTGRCGKPNCHCHQSNDPGHGPNPRLTYKVNGKSVTESLRDPGAIRKAEREIAEFRKLQSLHKDFIKVNAQICQLRPSESDSPIAQEKKTAAALQKEISREVDQLLSLIFQSRRKSGLFDLEACEMAVRSAMHRAGAAALTELLQFPVPAADQRTIACSCGQLAHYREQRSKTLLTVVGKVEVSRPYYLCLHCHKGQCPADNQLDVEHTEASPGVRRMLATVGQAAPFDQGRRQMRLLAGLEVTAKAVERTAEDIGTDIARAVAQQVDAAVNLSLPIVRGEPIPVLYIEMDGTGVPVVKAETEGRQGKIAGQPAHTREAKLGCVFTQTTQDEGGYAIRDPGSTTYTGAIETATEFGNRIYLEAWNRGWSLALTKVVIGDGAEWIWNIASQHFPGAIQIVDLYHARQHLWIVARCLFPLNKLAQNRWISRHQPKLDGGQIQKLVAFLRSLKPSSAAAAETILAEAAYFKKHAHRMRYPQFRRQHLFIGSGVVEAGCKTVIGSRCKQSGMFWTVRGANAILALRCCHINSQFEDYWERRAA